jgi:hypothetical protein
MPGRSQQRLPAIAVVAFIHGFAGAATGAFGCRFVCEQHVRGVHGPTIPNSFIFSKRLLGENTNSPH